MPVRVMLFDLLHINAASAARLPYLERRALLEQIVRPGARWQVPVYFTGHTQAALEASLQLALEGVVSKRVDSPYRPGRRSADWVKVKHHQTAEVVIGGWHAGGGRHAGLADSLLLGVPDGRGRLEYVGHVGT
ncbi:ATP-dependent DNA ligase, partial [Nonomuraea sp. NPDC003754]